MASKKQFENELARHQGATLDQETIQFDFHVDAPRGFVWKASGCHCLTAPHANEQGQSWKREAYDDLIDRMKMGLEPCGDADCQICNEEEN